MLCIGLSFMVIGLICTILFIPSFITFAIYGFLYPILKLSFMEGSLPLLPVILTVAYLVLLAMLGVLAPFVYRFQSLRADIVDVKGFPGIFYADVSVIRELHLRFNRDIDAKAMEIFLDAKFGRDILREIKSYV